jgi:hypothetical protein
LSLKVLPDKVVFALDNTRPEEKAAAPEGPWTVEFVPLDKGGAGVTVLVNGEFWAAGPEGSSLTWGRPEGAVTRPLPARWQTAKTLRFIAVSKDWGQPVKLIVRHNGKVLKAMDFTKEYVIELTAR